jgi:hypothetical protein
MMQVAEVLAPARHVTRWNFIGQAAVHSATGKLHGCTDTRVLARQELNGCLSRCGARAALAHALEGGKP